MEPLVSVVTPTYNRPEYLPKAVETVQNQSYENIEHIIVDGGSSTSPVDIFSTIPDHVTIRNQTSTGVSAARNEGIELSNGEFIAFLDDDDEWHPSKIERQVNRALAADAGVVYCGIKQELDGSIFATQAPDLNGEITEKLLVDSPLNSTSTIMVRSDILEEVGNFDEELPILEDWEFYIRASTATVFASCPDLLVTRHHHDGQITSNYSEIKHATNIIYEKHHELANEYGVLAEFKSQLESAIAATAIKGDSYRDARRHYIEAFRLDPSSEKLPRLVAILGGRWSYKPLQKVYRGVASIIY